MARTRDTGRVGELAVQRAGVALAGEEAGEGIPVVLLHGLTATRRYVVMGSRALERSGHRVIAYDARGTAAPTPRPSRGSTTMSTWRQTWRRCSMP